MRSFEGRELPVMALLGNKVDLNHIQAVKVDSHSKFASSNKMKGYYCSAKTGDQVGAVFYNIASELSGVPLSKSTLDVLDKKVKAEIVSHDAEGRKDANGLMPEDRLK
jgi:Ras-related protein Rab-28